MPRPRSDSWRPQSSARRPLPRPRALPSSGFSSLEMPAHERGPADAGQDVGGECTGTQLCVHTTKMEHSLASMQCIAVKQHAQQGLL